MALNFVEKESNFVKKPGTVALLDEDTVLFDEDYDEDPSEDPVPFNVFWLFLFSSLIDKFTTTISLLERNFQSLNLI